MVEYIGLLSFACMQFDEDKNEAIVLLSKNNGKNISYLFKIEDNRLKFVREVDENVSN